VGGLCVDSLKPLAIDLFCGLGGWADGFLAEGYDVIGFDIERHDYGTGGYPGQLVLQDVLTLHGSQFRSASVIVASPPCQEYSYMAMPWSRAKQIAVEYRSGVRDVKKLTALFDACFRIADEAGLPIVVENVRGATPWVGQSRWHYGSFHLWGDVPALMPMTFNGVKTNGHVNLRDGHAFTKHLTAQFESDAVKQHGSGPAWFDNGIAKLGSKSTGRKAASAQIAKIPLPLSRHIAQVFKPQS
jgi:hypothetical protein